MECLSKSERLLLGIEGTNSQNSIETRQIPQNLTRSVSIRWCGSNYIRRYISHKKINLYFIGVERSLVLASGASRGESRLRVGKTFLNFGTLDKHGSVGDISTLRIFVSLLSRVVSGSIRRVSFEGLERVEVLDRTRGRRVELLVDDLLAIVVPHLSVVLSVLKVEGGRGTHDRSRGEGGSRSNKGGEKGELHLLTRKGSVM